MSASTQQVETHTAVASGEHIEFRLVRMSRRRHAHLFVDADRGVEVRASTRFSAHDARSFVTANGAWVRSRLAELRGARPALVSGARLPLLDEVLTLSVCTAGAQMNLLELDLVGETRTPRRGRAPVTDVYRERQRLVVKSQRAGVGAVREGLADWYKGTAGSLLPERTLALAAEVGLQPSRVRVKAQRSMWGSCSASAEISLNWRLVLVPQRLADYVIVHELCHIAHHDHSDRFWARVAQSVPDYRACRAELRERQDRLPL